MKYKLEITHNKLNTLYKKMQGITKPIPDSGLNQLLLAAKNPEMTSLHSSARIPSIISGR